MSNIYNKTRNDKEEYFDECLELYERRELYEDYSSSQTRSGIDMAEAYRVVRMRTESMMYEKISVTVFRVGDIGIIGLGGEPFTNYANALRSNFSGKKILTSCNANGSQGYLPTVKAFEQGGYETMSSPFSPDTEAKCVAEATELLKKLEL